MNSEATDKIVITEEMLLSLRERVKDYLTDKRYLHTLAVEREAARLGEIFFGKNSEKLPQVRASALLHDITKRISLEKQLHYCEKFGIMVRKDDLSSPKIFHAKTAAELLKRDFSEFSCREVVQGVRWHTTGHYGMTTFEAIVYLADYIEETRTFDDCVKLREFFYTKLDKGEECLDEILCETMILSFNMTIKNLVEEEAPIDTDTIGARNFYLEKLKSAREC